PDDACTKTGCKVCTILAEKDLPLQVPDTTTPESISFHDYGPPPDIIATDCLAGDAEKITRQLRSSAGCSGMTAKTLKNTLLRHDQASADLRDELTAWATWLTNTSPPWAAYHAMRQGCLIALDKQLCARPIQISETWMCAVYKRVLAQCGTDGKEACGNSQLCTGLEAVIKGAIHATTQKAATEEDFTFNKWEVINDSWGGAMNDPAPLPDPPSATAAINDDTATPAHRPPMPPDDPAVLLLANADNGFQNLSRYSMLWETRHQWRQAPNFPSTFINTNVA
ncbi:hypothetical protein ACHAW6_001386, partial [Cyclotella cf. meneghiniana]